MMQKYSDEFLAGVDHVVKKLDHPINLDEPLETQLIGWRQMREKNAKIDEACTLLHHAGYLIHNPASIPSLTDAVNFLRLNGYTVNEPPAPAPAEERPGSRHAMWRD